MEAAAALDTMKIMKLIDEARYARGMVQTRYMGDEVDQVHR
jgi:hypothetical protein